VSSPLPVIISIENHLSLDQQVAMVADMHEIFGKALQTDFFPGDGADSGLPLPSPDMLAYKILIKTKARAVGGPAGGDDFDDDALDDEDDDDGVVLDEEEVARRESVLLKVRPHLDGPLATGSDQARAGSSSPTRDQHLPAKRASVANVGHRNKGVATELFDIVNYCNSHKFVSFEHSDTANSSCFNLPTFSEKVMVKLLTKSKCGAQLRKMAERQLLRVYPSPKRIQSSNFNPQMAWAYVRMKGSRRLRRLFWDAFHKRWLLLLLLLFASHFDPV
jgi:hypothetical protein